MVLKELRDYLNSVDSIYDNVTIKISNNITGTEIGETSQDSFLGEVLVISLGDDRGRVKNNELIGEGVLIIAGKN